jgi:hypothetical protein
MQRVFVTGEQLQRNRQEGCDITNNIIEMEDALQHEHTQTQISHSMRTMVMLDNENLNEPIQNTSFISKDGSLLWSSFTQRAMTGTNNVYSEYTYERDIPLLPTASIFLRRALIHHIHPFTLEAFSNSTVTEIMNKYSTRMSLLPPLPTAPKLDEFGDHVTSDNALFLELVQMYRREQYHLCFAMGIVYLERAIGDIIFASGRYEWRHKTRNIKMNEILGVPILHEVLGPDVIFLLRVVCGPVEGMNLRNRVWHGAFSDGIPAPYASLLLMLIVSITELPDVLKALQPRRILKDLSHFNTLAHVPPIDMDTMIDSSYFIPMDRRAAWKQAISLCREGNHYYCAVLLFPLLEHAMRRLYNYYNEIESDLEPFHCNFDDILQPHMEFGVARNKLFDKLDPSLLFAIHDMLVWREGPGVRDLVSHGAVDPHTIASVMDHVVLFVIQFCKRFDYKSPNHNVLDEYIPRYHPQVGLFREIEETAIVVEQFYTDCVANAQDGQSGDNALLSNDMKDQVITVSKKVGHLLATSFNHHSSFYTHTARSQINHELVPFVIPFSYADKLGNNINAIEIMRYVCRDVITITKVVRDGIAQAEYRLIHDKRKDKAQKNLDKITYNIHSTYQMIVLMMRVVEWCLFNINEPVSPLCQECSKLSESMAATFARNVWPKPILVQRLLEKINSLL